MSPLGVGLLVALGAAVGAPLRFLLGRRLDAGLPWGTLVANVVGSALLGVFSALHLSGALSTPGLALLGTGLCGGFTTYSSFAVQTHEHGPRRGSTYAALTIALSLGGCFAGFLVTAAAAGV